MSVGRFGRLLCSAAAKNIAKRNFTVTAANQADKRLYTPGPLGVSYETKAAMLRDLGSRDVEFINTVKYIRTKVLEVAGINTQEFTMIPMQGSGTFSIESVIMTTVPRENGKLLLIVAGAYGKRMIQIANYSNIPVSVIEYAENEIVDVGRVEKALKEDPTITNVAMVHCETTSGVIHPVNQVGALVRKHAPNATFMVDAMSSFGAIPIDVSNVDYVVTSANKCIEGVPGFGVVVARKSNLLQCKGRSRSLSLDLYEQFMGLEQNGQFRFTPPTHTILAFKKAVEIWEEEGGVEGRGRRYKANRAVLRQGMAKLGFEEFLSDDHLGYIITSYKYPEHENFSFDEFYRRLNEKDLVIYPGKVTNADCFRIGNIGNLVEQDMQDLLEAIHQVCQDMNLPIPLR